MLDLITYRMLITGSRVWDEPRTVADVLGHYLRAAHDRGGRLVVVHGAALGGADHLAAGWVAKWRGRGYPVDMEAHPARWSAPCEPDGVPPCKQGTSRFPHRHSRSDGTTYCPMAGHRRNQHMVDTRPLVCAAFSRNSSSGTRDCVKRARRARIPLLQITWPERELVCREWLAEHAPPLVTDTFDLEGIR